MADTTGGPAFPTENARQVGANAYHYEGMTLRDYFAAKAMQAALANGASTSTTLAEIAWASYMVADAMLNAREAGNG